MLKKTILLQYKALRKVMDRTNITVTKLKKSEFITDGLIQDLNRLLKFKESQQQDANAFPETRKTVAMTSLAAAIKYSALLSDNTNFGRSVFIFIIFRAGSTNQYGTSLPCTNHKN